MSDYIERQAATDAVRERLKRTPTLAIVTMDAVEKIKPADVLPYSIEPDGTLTITVPKGMKVGRVLVQEDGTQWGGLFYAD